MSAAEPASVVVNVRPTEELPLWKGERFADGRPKVPDGILKRMKLVTLEEAWAVLKGDNFKHQYDDGWQMINPDSVLVGRAVTATFMPGRPDIHRAIDDKGHNKDGRIKSQNAWTVALLVKGDVYVVDQFGATEDGPTIGDNVGQAILTNSGNGIVYDGAIRDINGLKEFKSLPAKSVNCILPKLKKRKEVDKASSSFSL